MCKDRLQQIERTRPSVGPVVKKVVSAMLWREVRGRWGSSTYKDSPSKRRKTLILICLVGYLWELKRLRSKAYTNLEWSPSGGWMAPFTTPSDNSCSPTGA